MVVCWMTSIDNNNGNNLPTPKFLFRLEYFFLILIVLPHLIRLDLRQLMYGFNLLIVYLFIQSIGIRPSRNNFHLVFIRLFFGFIKVRQCQGFLLTQLHVVHQAQDLLGLEFGLGAQGEGQLEDVATLGLGDYLFDVRVAEILVGVFLLDVAASV